MNLKHKWKAFRIWFHNRFFSDFAMEIFEFGQKSGRRLPVQPHHCETLDCRLSHLRVRHEGASMMNFERVKR